MEHVVCDGWLKTDGYGQTCASCTGVEVADECQHHIKCDANEVCSMHHYITESGASLFDYGCAFPQACLQSFGPIFGRRSDGHHVKCAVCCNATKVCNEDLTCQRYPHRNDLIHQITSNGDHSLQFIMTDYEGVTKYAKYQSFSISNETSDYKLSVGNFSGNAGDSFTGHSGYKFTTKDRDNDLYSGNCATLYIGAWWYSSCHSSNLNGKYYHVSNSSYAKGIDWVTWHGHYYSLKATTMMIRKNTK
ncbi:FCN [Mytilus edulis]|uniref:FCN n=1 Tax=Mytilus edulis TaxID=6550 RepID=A0A8S3SGJ9_MYTED|nr:FCN [Mytilus edulis]